jgi:hypothetical protein
VAWRVLFPVLAIACLVAGVAGERVVLGGLAVIAACGAIAAWRDYARVDRGVLYERGPVRWHRPVVLSDVTEVALHYKTWLKDLPHRELWLWSDEGHYLTIVSLRWWANWRPFVAAIVDAISEPGPYNSRTWAVKIDGKSARRLAEIADASPRT